MRGSRQLHMLMIALPISVAFFTMAIYAKQQYGSTLEAFSKKSTNSVLQINMSPGTAAVDRPSQNIQEKRQVSSFATKSGMTILYTTTSNKNQQ